MAAQKERLAKKAGIEIGVKIFTCAWQRKIKYEKKEIVSLLLICM